MLEYSLFLFIFIVAACIGSFLNVLIYRLPLQQSIIWPPSSCPACRHRLAGYDLIPIISYLWLKGKCRYCQQPIHFSYLVIELLTGLFTLAWAFRFGLVPAAIWRLILGYGLIVIAAIDLKTYLIPNRLTYPLFLGGLIYRLSQGEIISALLGVGIAGSVMLLIYLLYPQGIGIGDLKLLLVLGIFLGGHDVMRALFFGSLTGILILYPLVWRGLLQRHQPIPFAPFLAFGTFVVLFLP